MDGLHNYLELVENGRKMKANPPAPSLVEPLKLLVKHAARKGPLDVEAAWRLDSRECRTLEQYHGYAPPGGWAALGALACGCGVLRAQRESFELDIEPAEVARWSSEKARRRLCEAYTRSLVPPSTAAGLFILLGLHPAWGLRVAHRIHRRSQGGGASTPGGGIEPGWRDESLFPDEVTQCVEEAVFSAIASTLAALRKLTPGYCYPVDALAGLVEQACRFARETAEEKFEPSLEPGLTPFMTSGDEDDGERNFRTLDFVTIDLLDSLLVPAGIARKFDDGTFCIYEGALDEVRVGELDAEAQQVKLTWLLAGECGCMVA